MRIDKFITSCGVASRREAALVARKGGVRVNGIAVRRLDGHIDPERDTVSYEGRALEYRAFTYIMMNKPAGVISSTDQPGDSTVMDLLPRELQRIDLFPCGRLDRDTTGLLLITNDGETAHRLLSPKKHAEKLYSFTLDKPLPDGAEDALAAGITFASGEACRPAGLVCDAGRRSGRLILVEGKFHQVKRMMAFFGSTVLTLRRLSFGPLQLDRTLPEGEWRYLTEEEIASLPRPEK